MEFCHGRTSNRGRRRSMRRDSEGIGSSNDAGVRIGVGGIVTEVVGWRSSRGSIGEGEDLLIEGYVS
jgi:hypothetical protein